MIAAELEAMGYKVHRLPFGIIQSESPANMVRFYDPEKGRCEVMLAKYPVHNERGTIWVGYTAGTIEGKVVRLQAAAQNWQDKPSDTQYQALMDAFTQVWAEMDSTDKNRTAI